MDLGVAAEEMEGLSDNLPKREVFCGFSDPFSGLCVSHACIPGKQETRPLLDLFLYHSLTVEIGDL
jgi:hypothetical protein